MTSVLVVGAETPALQRVVPLLLRADFVVHRLAGGDEAAAVLADRAFDLVIIRYPTSGVPLSELVDKIRAPGSPNRNAGVLVLAAAESSGDVRGLLGHGVNRVVTLEGSSEGLLLAVADMIAVPPRLSLRAVVQLELWVQQGALRVLTLTRNISASGMLVQGGTEFPVGSRVRFDLTVPGEETSIRGEAEVVRHALQDEARGVGVRFCSFEDDGLERLSALLQRRLPLD